MPDQVAVEPTADVVEDGAKPDETLGESGKKALESERAARKAAETERTDALARLKEFEDRDKSEADKAAERLAEAEKRAVELEARATRSEVAAATGIPADILAGPKSPSADDVQSFADALSAHIKQIAEQAGSSASSPLIIPAEGKTPKAIPLNGDGLETALRDALGIA